MWNEGQSTENTSNQATVMSRHADALILRRNWRDTRAYLAYCTEVRQTTLGTASVYRGALDLLLRWSRDCALPSSHRLRPTFPVWLAGRALSISYQAKTCAIVRGYLSWAKAHYPRYDSLPPDLIDATRAARPDSQPHVPELYSVDDVRRILDLQTDTLTQRRDLAAVAFLFLSGMRVGAFVSLPIEAVDLDRWMVKQWPALGVRTKGSTAANTWILPIVDLRVTIQHWDKLVRRSLPASAPWYALVDQGGHTFAVDQTPGRRRGIALNQRLRILCDRAGIPYRSAHKLRHGHAVYALRRTTTMEEFKAVSQNLMHSTMQTTDAIYAALLDEDVGSVITNLADVPEGGDPVLALLRELQAQLQPAAGPAVW